MSATEAVTAWREAIRAKRETEEQQWAALNEAVQGMLYHHGVGQLGEAEDMARVALDAEYRLIGNCEITSALCDALGISSDPESPEDG